MKTFWIDGSLKINFDTEIDAENEEEARNKFIRHITDYYHLDTLGSYHDYYNVDIESGEFDDE